MADKENVITKTYDLLLYMIPQLAKFPRDQKFLLADRIENRMLDFLEAMIEAYYSKKKLDILEKSNLKLESLRYLIRLSFDLHFINSRRYAYVTGHVDEIGRMLGGWKKSIVIRE